MNDVLFFQSFEFLDVHYTKDQHNIFPNGLSTHHLGYLKTGRALLVADGIRIELYPGDLFYIPNNVPYHSYWYGTEDTSFDSFGFGYLPSPVKKYALQKIAYDNEARELLLKLSSNKTVDCNTIGLLYSLYGRIEPNMQLHSTKPQSELMYSILRYMNENPNISISRVAKKYGISMSSLYRLFHTHLKQTPNELRHRILCEKAIELLTTTDLPIEHISANLGFSSSSYFRKILFAETQKTPRQIRKEATTL